MKKQRIIYLFIGILMLANTIIFNIFYLENREFPEYIILLGITIMAFCLAYVSEHLIRKDERSKKIRERAIYISFFWILAASLAVLVLINPSVGMIKISAYHLLLSFVTFSISIVFINYIYYSKKY